MAADGLFCFGCMTAGCVTLHTAPRGVQANSGASALGVQHAVCLCGPHSDIYHVLFVRNVYINTVILQITIEHGFTVKTAAQAMFTNCTISDIAIKYSLANFEDDGSKTYKVMPSFCLFSFQWLHILPQGGLFNYIKISCFESLLFENSITIFKVTTESSRTEIKSKVRIQ